MIIGFPKEKGMKEGRVAVTPDGVSFLKGNNQTILVEKSAGEGVGFSDEDYKKAGAKIVDTPEELYSSSEMIVKVLPPLPSEVDLLKKEQILFCFLHLGSDKNLTQALLNKKVTAIAYEQIRTEDNKYPVLLPMSEIAGKMSVQIAANLLSDKENGSGLLLGGIAGVPSAKVLIIGAGAVGINAAKVAAGMGADVKIADISTKKLRSVANILGSQIKTFVATGSILENLVKESNVVIGAVHANKYSVVITESMVKSMKKGSVIVDISIDEGGIVETEDRMTTLDNPTYIKHGVIHYCVPNIASSVAKTATIALTNETLDFIESIAENGVVNAIKKDTSLFNGVMVYNGLLTSKAISSTHQLEYNELSSLIGF
ncbi:alanine dehydrogenase [bacterium]|nr:alanine dehydrogenase [bacterium]